MINLPLKDRIILFKDSDLTYGFDDSGPSFYIRRPEVSYGTHIKLDSFPCYHHDINLVLEFAKKAEEAFPIDVLPYWYILPFEPLSRCNGEAGTNYGYDINDKREPYPHIILGGKRIPPMQNMTRYLCLHEYGHCVDNFICKKKKYTDTYPTQLDKEYAKMRGIECNDNYGNRKWHTNIGEIIANDFRICVGKVEKDFWPHDVKHPDLCPEVHDFWYKMMLEFCYK